MRGIDCVVVEQRRDPQRLAKGQNRPSGRWSISTFGASPRSCGPYACCRRHIRTATSTTNIGTHRRCAKSSTPITSRRTNGCRLEGACQLSRAARPDLRAPLRRIADLVWTAPLARAAAPARTRSKPAPGIICRRSAYPSKSCGTVTRTAGEPTRLSSSSCARTATSPGPAMNRRLTQPRSSPRPLGAKRSSPRLCAVHAVLIFFPR